MFLLDRLLRWLASSEDRLLLAEDPSARVRLRVIGRIGLRYWWAYSIALVIALVVTVASGVDVYRRTSLPEFCGACHEMGANFDTWKVSRHTTVTCADCHARTGFVGWMSAKMGGMRQLVTHFTAESIGDISLGEHHLEIVSDNCQRCHPGATRLGERSGLVMAHQQHLDAGIMCATCHSGSFTHPKEQEPDLSSRGMVDVSKCHQCHSGTQQVGNVTPFAADNEKNCTRCHPDSVSALQHGVGHPKTAARKPCLDCHVKEEESSHYAMTESVGPMCVGCHAKSTAFENFHEPYDSDECEACHKVMSPAYLYRLGPKPANALCFECHDDMKTLVESEDPGETVSQFADGDSDLHYAHGDALGDDDPGWCIACHGPHGSNASVGLVRLRAVEDGEKPGVFSPTEEGGSCDGSCHEGDEREYAR